MHLQSDWMLYRNMSLPFLKALFPQAINTSHNKNVNTQLRGNGLI